MNVRVAGHPVNRSGKLDEIPVERLGHARLLRIAPSPLGSSSAVTAGCDAPAWFNKALKRPSSRPARAALSHVHPPPSAGRRPLPPKAPVCSTRPHRLAQPTSWMRDAQRTRRGRRDWSASHDRVNSAPGSLAAGAAARAAGAYKRRPFLAMAGHLATVPSAPNPQDAGNPMTMLQAFTLETVHRLPDRLSTRQRLRLCRHSSDAVLRLEGTGDACSGVVAGAVDVSNVKTASGLIPLCRPISTLENEER